MDQLVLGKELPNLKITLAGLDSNNAAPCTDTIDIMEVDEIQDEKDAETDEKVKVEVKVEFMPYKEMKKYENKSSLFASGLDIYTEKMQDKLEERAERFHLQPKPINNVTQDEIDALYKSLNIPTNVEKFSDRPRGIRLDAIHFRGVNDMSTEDIFDYFKDYSPASIEWINDISCNVVWLDEKNAAHALLELSRPIIIRSKKNNMEVVVEKNDKSEISEERKEEGEEVVVMSDDEMSEDEPQENTSEKDDDNLKDEKKEIKNIEENNSEVAKEKLEALPIPVPPGHWRLGVPHPKAKALLLRFANKDDKKIRGAEKRSLYYKKYGNPNYGGLKGIISNSRKRQFWQIQQKKELQQLGVNNINSKSIEKLSASSSESETEETNKVEHSTKRKLRMKMYADEEEVKQKQKKKRISDNLQRKQSSSVEEEPENKKLIDKPESEMVADRLSHSNLSVWNRLNDKKKIDHSNYHHSEDLRSKLQSRIDNKPEWTRSVTPIMGDLRNKLDQIRNKRNTENHRSPLLIHVINKQND